jgi:hypothetical protein
MVESDPAGLGGGAVTGAAWTNRAMTSAKEAPCTEIVVFRVTLRVFVNSSPKVAHGKKPSRRKGKCPSMFPLIYANISSHLVEIAGQISRIYQSHCLLCVPIVGNAAANTG